MNVNAPKSHADSSPKMGNMEPPLYRIDRLISLSSLSNLLAWGILVVSIIFFAATTRNLWMDHFSPSLLELDLRYTRDLTYYLASFFPTIIGLFLFIILRIVAEGILLFMDIEINLRELSQKKE